MANDRPGSDDSEKARRVAVVVVHGVGDTQPGVAMNEVIDTLEQHFPDQIQAKPYSEVYRLAASPIVKGEAVDRFPAYARSATLTATGDKIRFYDLHWADLTRALPGRFNAFLGLFRIIFESHHFVDAMLPKDGGRLTRVLRSLLIWTAAILRGPIVGVSACLVAVGLVFYWSWNGLRPLTVFLYGSDATENMDKVIVGIVLVVMTSVFLGALYFFYRNARARETEWNDVCVAIMFGALFVGTYAALLYAFPQVQFLRGLETRHEEPICLYVERFYYLTQSARALWCVLLIAGLSIVTWLYAFKRKSLLEARPSAAMAAASVVVLQSALWLSILSAGVIPILRQAHSQRIAVCGLDGLFVSFAGTAMLLVNVGSLVVATYIVRSVFARAPMASLERRAQFMPRLLFGGAITLAVLSGALFQIFVFGLAYITEFLDKNFILRGLDNLLANLPTSKGQATEWFDFIKANKNWFYAPLGILAVGLSMLISGGFTTAIHIARDLIDHQYSPSLGYSYYLLPRRWRLGPRRPRRLRIRERLNALSQDVICQEPFDDLIFIAHSQGSVIVYDYLRSGGSPCEQLLRARPHLVTFGSPLGHLYQFYFKEYRELDKGIAGLRPKLSSWTNLYRVDDYVGRKISDEDGFVDNKVMRAGGHVNYWCDRALCEVILERIRTPASPAAASAAS
jgi:hypothetical protein